MEKEDIISLEDELSTIDKIIKELTNCKQINYRDISKLVKEKEMIEFRLSGLR